MPTFPPLPFRHPRLPAAIVLMAMMTTSQMMSPQQQQRPHIVLLVAEDFGWADVQSHDPSMRTPNLLRLAEGGMVLNSSYVLPTSTPTRAALLAGSYPFTFGMQVDDFQGASRSWLESSLSSILPATLRDLGYATHMVGKWHLGLCEPAFFPTRRGFETFYGFYSGDQSFLKQRGNSSSPYGNLDNEGGVLFRRGHTATVLHSARAQRIIRDHASENRREATRDKAGASDPQRPLFLLVSYQNVQKKIASSPRLIEQKYCMHIKGRRRRKVCGRVANMDESIGNITRSLKEEGLTDNTIIVFMSLNGGKPNRGSFNYPLRGIRGKLWEGATRSYTIISSPLLSHRNASVYTGLIHAVDWYPTLLQAAGGNPTQRLHGLAMWNQLRHREPSLRTEFVYNINDKIGRSALRWKNWKLILRESNQGGVEKGNGWYRPPPAKYQGGMKKLRLGSHVKLFDLTSDPEEKHDMHKGFKNKQVIKLMTAKLKSYWKDLKPWSPVSQHTSMYKRGWC